MDNTTVWRIAGGLGALGVLLGAFGAHGLKSVVTDPHLLEVWDTGARYHLVHAVAIAACANHPRPAVPVALFVLGTLLFAGSLYAMALTDVRMLGAVTPFGGVSFIAGWVVLAVTAREPA
jgi:uncharacterized membrane protein YgdD (TMEM256/DUF423 family)